MFNVILKMSTKGIFKSRAREAKESFTHVRAGDGCGEDSLDQGANPGVTQIQLTEFPQTQYMCTSITFYSILFAFWTTLNLSVAQHHNFPSLLAMTCTFISFT